METNSYHFDKQESSLVYIKNNNFTDLQIDRELHKKWIYIFGVNTVYYGRQFFGDTNCDNKCS